MNLKQKIAICDISSSVFIGRCVKNFVAAYEDDNITLNYITKDPRRGGGAVIYLCNEENYSDYTTRPGGYAVLISEDPYYGYNDVDKDIFDVIYTENTSDELIKFRLNACINKVNSDYKAQVNEILLQTIIDSAPDMAWFKDVDGRHIVLNDAFCRIVGKDKEACIDKEHPDIWDISWEEYKSSDFACRKSEEEIIKTGKTGVFEEMVMTNGELKAFTTYKTPVYDAYDNVIGTCGIARDANNVHNMGLEMSILMDNVPFPMILCDGEWNPVRSNNEFLSMTGLGSINGFDYRDWKDKDVKVVSEITYANDSLSNFREIEMEKDGETLWYILTEQAIIDLMSNVTGYFCILQDITYRRKYEHEILKVANTDALTGLYNRRYMVNCISDNMDKEMSLLYMDIDSFKEVNDQFGHKKGDEILRKTADAIKEQYPEGICARLGGDEFLVLLVGENGKVISDKRNKELIKKVESFVRVAGTMISLSIGVSRDAGVQDVEKFINDADKKMYESKKRRCKSIA